MAAEENRYIEAKVTINGGNLMIVMKKPLNSPNNRLINNVAITALHGFKPTLTASSPNTTELRESELPTDKSMPPAPPRIIGV